MAARISEADTPVGTGLFQTRRAAVADDTVDVNTAAKVDRHVFHLRGMTVELIDVNGRERVDIRFRGAAHLLVVHEQGYRLAGETLAERAAGSAQRDLSRKLTLSRPAMPIMSG